MHAHGRNCLRNIGRGGGGLLHRLSEKVDDIDNTTVKMSEFFDVTMKVTTLEGDIEQVNITLAMKADQQDINEITEMITSLRETTVKRNSKDWLTLWRHSRLVRQISLTSMTLTTQ